MKVTGEPYQHYMAFVQLEKLRVPEDLFIDEILEICPADDIEGFHKDKVYLICDSIYYGMEQLDENNVHPDKKQPYFVPLNTKILRKVLGGNCCKGILDWMVANWIIEADGSWQNGKVAQGYKFSDYFIDLEYTWKTVTCRSLLKKEVSDYFEKKLYFQPAIAKRLQKWFHTGKLQIDADRAFEVISTLERDEVLAANGNRKEIRKAKLNADASRRKVGNIVKGRFLFLQDPYGYRIHTVLTQLPKELRSLVTYDGKQLVEVDLSCSQLFFSCFLLDYRHWRGAKFKTYKAFTKEIWEGISILSSNNSKQYSNTIMKIVSLESFYGKGFQAHPFLKKCCEGLLYESVVDRLDAQNFFPADYHYKSKRNEVKILLLQQLFAEPKHKGLFRKEIKPILDAFTALYPEVAYVYQQIKEGREKGRYKDLCSLFQRVESVAMQGFVCKRLQQEYPELPIFTLHDCLITTAGNEVLITKVMEEGITKYMGFTPKMKPTYWSKYSELIPEKIELPKAA